MHRGFIILPLVAHACVSFDYGSSPFTCSQSQRCPGGYSCVAGRCELPGFDARSEASRPDARTDSPPLDRLLTDRSSSNLITNPGFENGSTGWKLDQAVVVAGGANGFGHSLLLTAAGTTKTAVQQVGNLSKGSYRFEVWVQTKSITAGDFGNAQPQAGVRWLDSGGAVVVDWTWIHGGQGTGPWTQKTTNLTAPAGTAQAEVILKTWAEVKSGEVYFDDVLLVLAP